MKLISEQMSNNQFLKVFDHFSTLRRKGLNYNFQGYFKGLISIIFCKTLTFRNAQSLQSKQNLFKVCLETVISKNSYHYRKLIDSFLYCTEDYSEKAIGNFKIFEKSDIHYPGK